jgi:hypothetical protein
MELKQLDKATKIYSDIQKIDAEIIEIERLASLVANGEVKSSFELKVVDKQKQEEESQKLEFDEDGDIIRPNCVTFDHLHNFPLSILRLQNYNNKESKSRSANTLSSNLSESTTLQILAVLLNEKKKRRIDLINKLKSFGVNA